MAVGSISTNTEKPKLVRCTVCNQGSHRLDWQDGKPHACESHGSTAPKQETATKEFPGGTPGTASAGKPKPPEPPKAA